MLSSRMIFAALGLAMCVSHAEPNKPHSPVVSTTKSSPQPTGAATKPRASTRDAARPDEHALAIEWIIHGIRGGVRGFLNPDGSGIIGFTTYDQKLRRAREVRHALAASKARADKLRQIIHEQRLMHLNYDPGSAVPGNILIKIRLKSTTGTVRELKNWAGKPHAQIDALLAELKLIEHSAAALPVQFQGDYEPAWRPEAR
jgi:hypothetical protein